MLRFEFFPSLLCLLSFLLFRPLRDDHFQEFSSGDLDWSIGSLAALFVSCLLGCGISYFAFLCRKVLSATAFTVVG
jgi:hypothetical protein